MRKLLSLLTAILFAGTMFAADVSVTIAASSDGSNWTAKGKETSGNTTTVVKNGITVTSDKGYYTSAHVREYSGSVITVSSTEGNIKSIEFTSTNSGTADKGPSKISLKSGEKGSYSYSQYKGTWTYGSGTSDVSSVTFNATAQFRWTQVVVTYIGSSNPTATVDPTSLTFAPVGQGDAAPEAQSFTITGSNLEDALSIAALTNFNYSVDPTNGLTPDGDGAVSATVTVTPKDGFTDAKGSKSETLTISGGGLTANVTVTINAEVKAKHNIIFNTDLATIPNVSVMEGGTYNITETIEAALIENCTYTTFEGWTTQSDVTTGQSAKPTIASSVTMSTADVNLYPVFSGTSGSSAATLTKMVAGDEFANGDNIVIVAHDDADNDIALYQETVSTSYVQTWSFDNDVETVAADDKNYVTVSTATDGWYLGDDTNGYLNHSDNNLYCDNDQSIWTLVDNGNGTFKILSTNNRYLSYRSDLGTKKWRMGGASKGTSGVTNLDIYKYATGGSKTYSSDPVCEAEQCETPSFSPTAGTYYEAKTVELSTLTTGASIYYTTNGDDPTTSSTLYDNENKISVSKSMTIKAIAVKDGMDNSDIASATYTLKCAQPTITKNAALFLETATVTITCETAGVEIRYTTNGDEPTASSTLYKDPFEITAATTVKAIAIKENWSNSEIALATFEKDILLTTIQGIYDKAVEVGGTATDVNITFNNWVVSGAKNANAYVTDGTKGFAIYTADNGFVAGDILTGTVACKLALVTGKAQVSNLTSTSTGLTVTKGGVITPVETAISALTAVNTGAPIIVNAVTYNGEFLVDASENTIKPYTTLYTGSFTSGKKYNVTGLYLQYNDTKEILPRSEDDIVENTTTALDNVESSAKAVKVLKNGLLLIEKNGKTYNAQGQLVK